MHNPSQEHLSVQRLWFLPFQIGFPATGSSLGFEPRIFKCMGFFLLSTHWMLPILHEILFCFQPIYYLPVENYNRKNKRTGKCVRVYSVSFTVLPHWQSHYQTSDNFWFYLVIFLGHCILFLTQCMSYAAYYPFIQIFSWKCILVLHFYQQLSSLSLLRSSSDLNMLQCRATSATVS